MILRLVVLTLLLCKTCLSSLIAPTKLAFDWLHGKLHTFTANWTAIDCSDDGRVMMAVSPRGRGIYVSTDYGARWDLRVSREQEEQLSPEWIEVAVSGDGNQGLALVNGGSLIHYVLSRAR